VVRSNVSVDQSAGFRGMDLDLLDNDTMTGINEYKGRGQHYLHFRTINRVVTRGERQVFADMIEWVGTSCGGGEHFLKGCTWGGLWRFYEGSAVTRTNKFRNKRYVRS